MIIAADWLSISTNLLLVVNIVICLLLCLVVLMQRPKQEGLGAAFGGGMTDQAFGARTTDVLQKGTVYLGSLFFIVTFALSVLASAETREEMKAEKAALEAAEADAAKAEQLANEATQDEVNAATEGETAEPAAPTEEEATPAPAETPAPEATPAPEGDENASSDTETGATIGAAGGGIIGHQSGNAERGAAIGAAVGGTTGEPKADVPAEEEAGE